MTIENPKWRPNSLQTEEQRVPNGPQRETASGATRIRPAELGVIANLGAKLVRPQTDKMSEKLDDMVGGVGDVRHSGETSAEEDVEDEPRVETARDTLRKRPTCHSSHPFAIGVQNALRDEPMTCRIITQGSKQKFCQLAELHCD